MNWQSFLQGLIQTEEAMIPVFVHNPQSQAIAAVLLVAEGSLASVLGAMKKP